MSRFDLAAIALKDLEDLYDYIADDNPAAALQVLIEMEEGFELLAERPMLGVKRPEYGHRMRMWPIGEYLIFYRPMNDGVRVARVLHSKRKIRRLIRRPKKQH